MKITIGAYDPDTRQVSVTFEQGAVVHSRPVNACHAEDGSYDEAATEARVADVGRGVAQKIAVGAILPTPDEPADPA